MIRWLLCTTVLLSIIWNPLFGSDAENLAKARETAQRRLLELNEATAALQKRLEANSEWVGLRKRMRETEETLMAAEKTGTAEERRRAEFAFIRASFASQDLHRRLCDADATFTAAMRNLHAAAQEVQRLEARLAASTRPATTQTSNTAEDQLPAVVE